MQKIPRKPRLRGVPRIAFAAALTGKEGPLGDELAFARGAARSSAPGAIVIQFFGGIHEIYFPYVPVSYTHLTLPTNSRV